MNVEITVFSEAEILSQVVSPRDAKLAPEAARAILDLHFNEDAIRRINELAEKNRLGTLTDAERRLVENYQRVGNFLNLMQARARLSLKDAG